MSDIQLFQSDEFGELRTFTNGDEVSFVAKDVCTILGISKYRDALSRLDDDERGSVLLDTPGGKQQVSTVTESGFYRLVIVSRKPEAKAFQRWVTHEVLPAIRRKGIYATETTIDSILADPDNAIRLLTELKTERERGRRLALENASMRPKVEFYEEVMQSDGLISVRQSAKVLKSFDIDMGEKLLREALRQRGFIEKRTKHATALAIARGYMKERPFRFTHKDGREELSTYGVLTPKGLDWCIRNFCRQQRMELV